MRKSFSSFLLFVFLAFTSGLHGAIEKDLGQGLTYLRVTDAGADLKNTLAAIEQKKALVLDLRYLSAAKPGFAEALQSALARPPTLRSMRVVLLNATAAPDLIAALDVELPSVIVLGPKSAAFQPDIAVTTTAEEDRRAFDALATGTPMDKLVSGNHEKRRYDEAKLVHDHANGITPAEDDLPADADDESAPPEPAANGTKKPAAEQKSEPVPPYDCVLARAIHLHRALFALKKL